MTVEVLNNDEKIKHFLNKIALLAFEQHNLVECKT